MALFDFNGPAWALTRLPASFRGIPFVILDNSLRRGRQVALHTYPFRDDPWPEDMGRSPRITSFRGFVIGDDADYQIQALIDAVEQPGPGQLVHPVFGSILATVLTFVPSDDAKRGRVWSFEMTVVPYLDRIYPIAAANTQATTSGLFGATGDAIAKDFAAVKSTIAQARSAVTGVVSTVQSYAAQGFSLIRDATALAHIPASLAGNLGRFAGPGGLVTSVSLATSAATGAIASVDRIGSTLGTLAAKL